MFIKFTKLTKVLIITTITSLVAIETQANTDASAKIPLTDAFEAAYYENGENAFMQSSMLGQINTIVGIPKFPEQDIAADAKQVHSLYETALEKQTSAGERLITKDLDNPYDTSLRVNPRYGLIK